MHHHPEKKRDKFPTKSAAQRTERRAEENVTNTKEALKTSVLGWCDKFPTKSAAQRTERRAEENVTNTKEALKTSVLGWCDKFPTLYINRYRKITPIY